MVSQWKKKDLRVSPCVDLLMKICLHDSGRCVHCHTKKLNIHVMLSHIRSWTLLDPTDTHEHTITLDLEVWSFLGI